MLKESTVWHLSECHVNNAQPLPKQELVGSVGLGCAVSCNWERAACAMHHLFRRNGLIQLLNCVALPAPVTTASSGPKPTQNVDNRILSSVSWRGA